ncbi:MAG: hypothetical protein R3292_02575 [Alcanivorax sp.]|nr:hypothetical protein [Alcanivorax sp.]
MVYGKTAALAAFLLIFCGAVQAGPLQDSGQVHLALWVPESLSVSNLKRVDQVNSHELQASNLCLHGPDSSRLSLGVRDPADNPAPFHARFTTAGPSRTTVDRIAHRQAAGDCQNGQPTSLEVTQLTPGAPVPGALVLMIEPQ